MQDCLGQVKDTQSKTTQLPKMRRKTSDYATAPASCTKLAGISSHIHIHEVNSLVNLLTLNYLLSVPAPRLLSDNVATCGLLQLARCSNHLLLLVAEADNAHFGKNLDPGVAADVQKVGRADPEAR